MKTMSIEDAKSHLNELFDAAESGEAVFIERTNSQTMKLVPCEIIHQKRKLGSGKGLFIVSPDFDEPLEDFKEYM